MLFPTVNRISTKNVVTIPITKTINEAINKMSSSNHRDIIVVNDKDYHLLTVNDIISFKLENIDFDTPMMEIALKIVPQIHEESNILDAFKMIQEDIEYICLVNDERELCGIVTHTDIITNIDPEILMANSKVKDMIRNTMANAASKGTSTQTILNGILDTYSDCVIILEDEKPIGIVTTKDAVDIMANNLPLDKSIGEYMTSPVSTLNEDTPIKEALDYIKEKHFKRVVVVDEEGNLAGVILQKDLISMTYSKWAELMKHHHKELKEINTLLERRTEKLEKLASTDPLTQLYNRSVFVSLYEKEKAIMNRHKMPMSIVLMDIDHFKKINDTYGHPVGDKVLKKIAKLLTAHLRSSDVVCRWGGEEFIFLLPNTNISGAKEITEKLRKIIEKADFEEVQKVTASFGATQITLDDEIDLAVKRTDTALYKAKANGRNRVELG